ncbi:Uncharacterized protein APZ42_014304 [Daphnia magna]|uniref:Uncharacterized protein n=1 Tax=Daphnia magna TaxID=35525 RepID=A0A162Q7C6_9CRUS|nr:Uncharacterized protein APZ42_014304 [Daphnia magna]
MTSCSFLIKCFMMVCILLAGVYSKPTSEAIVVVALRTCFTNTILPWILTKAANSHRHSRQPTDLVGPN